MDIDSRDKHLNDERSLNGDEESEFDLGEFGIKLILAAFTFFWVMSPGTAIFVHELYHRIYTDGKFVRAESREYANPKTGEVSFKPKRKRMDDDTFRFSLIATGIPNSISALLTIAGIVLIVIDRRKRKRSRQYYW